VPWSAQAREDHPLLGAFPLAVTTLGICLLVFAMAMTALNSGARPNLGVSAGTSVVAKHTHRDALSGAQVAPKRKAIHATPSPFRAPNAAAKRA